MLVQLVLHAVHLKKVVYSYSSVKSFIIRINCDIKLQLAIISPLVGGKANLLGMYSCAV